MELIDVILRSASVGVGLLLIIHFLSLRPFSRKTLSAVLLVFAASLMVVVSSMIFKEFAAISAALQIISDLVFAFSAPLIAWGLLELFDDDFRVQPWQLAFVALSIPAHFMSGIDPIFVTICHATSIMIYSYLFFVAVETGRHDLVQARCQFRFWFMSAAGIAGIFFTGMHAYFGDAGLTENYFILQASILLSLCILFAYWALKVREIVWALPNQKPSKDIDQLSPAELSLLQKLETSMVEDVWRQEGLTIKTLAEILEAPEHRLRRVINVGLGYRNFAHFVNEHRIEAACEVLSDPVRADVPIITIAFEVGYASLGPFNRAFRDLVGESPTQYRKRSVSAL